MGLARGARRPYLIVMAVFPRPSTPAAAWRDLRAFLATRQRHQLVFAALALAIPALIVLAIVIQAIPSRFGRRTG